MFGSVLSAHAQDFAGLFRPGPSLKNFSFEETLYSGVSVNNSDEKLQQRNWRARANAPVWNNGKHEISAGGEAGELYLNHEFPVLRNYKTLQGSLGWRYYGETNKVRGVTMSYGSASDRPFADAENNVASANYLHQFNEKWWLAVNWSNNRNFANGVPIPGFFYVAKMSREETLLLGLPFVFWRKRFESGFGYQWTSFVPWNHQAEVTYNWGPFSGIALGFEHRPQQFLRDDRESSRDRFFFVEQKAYIALSGAIIPRVLQWRVEAGHAFNRRFFEARNFSQEKRFDIPVGDATFVGIQLTSNF